MSDNPFADLPPLGGAVTPDSDPFADLPPLGQALPEQGEEPLAVQPEEQESFMETSNREMTTAVSNAGERFADSDSLFATIWEAPEDAMLGLGKDIIPAAASIAGQAIAKGADAVLPDSVTNYLKNTSMEAMEWLLGTAAGKRGLDAAKTGASAYKGFAAANPDVAERLESMVNVGAMAAPATKVGASQFGKKITTQAKEGIKKNRKAGIKDLMEPNDKYGDDYDIGEAGQNRAGSQIFIPNQKGEAQIEAVTKIPEVRSDRSYLWNYPKIKAHSKKLILGIDDDIGKAGNPQVDTDALNARLQDAADNILERQSGLVLTDAAAGPAQRIVKEAIALVNESDGTALGILEVRRIVDKRIREATKEYDSTSSSGTKAAQDVLREELNAAVDAVLPDTMDFRNRQREVSTVITAGKQLYNESKKQAEKLIGRTLQRLKDSTGISMVTTPLAIAATGRAAVGLGVPAAVVTVVSVGALAGYMGVHAVISPSGRANIGKLITQLENLPRQTLEIKADRLALIALLEDSKEETGEHP